MKRFHWFEIALAAAVMAVHLYAALSEAHNFPQAWFTRDDAYFYFKTAQNISEGRGSTFDGINPTNGYHPLWMLACIPVFSLARFDLILPLRLLVIIMGGLSAASGVLIFRLLRRVLFEPIAMLAAAFWVFNTYIHASVTQYGLETGLLVFAILLLLRRLQSFEGIWQKQSTSTKEILIIAVLAVVAFLSRLDMIFLAGVTGVWVLLRGTPLRYYLISDALIITTSVLVSFVLRLGLPLYYDYSTTALVMAGSLLAIRIPLMYFLGLDERPGKQKPASILVRTALAVAIGSGACALVMLALSNRLNGLPRSVILIEAGLSVILLGGFRLGALWFRQKEPAPLEIPWKRILREGLVFFGVLGGVLAVYMLYNLAAFGTATPVSGQVKRWWADPVNQARGGPARKLDAFLGIDYEGDFNTWPQVIESAGSLSLWLQDTLGLPEYYRREIYDLALVSAIVLALALLAARRGRSLHAVQRLGLLPLFAGCGFQVFGYNATGYSAVKEWYWAGQMLFTLFMTALLADILLPRRLRHPKIYPALTAIVLLVCLAWFGRFSYGIQQNMLYGNSRANKPYVDAQAFLESNTEPGSIIGMTGGGNVGYFIQDRTIINMDGLINSNAYFKALQANQAADYLKDMGMDYVFANPNILSQLTPFKAQFKGRIERLGIRYGSKELLIIR